jgi:hypothetical protein
LEKNPPPPIKKREIWKKKEERGNIKESSKEKW